MSTRPFCTAWTRSAFGTMVADVVRVGRPEDGLRHLAEHVDVEARQLARRRVAVAPEVGVLVDPDVEVAAGLDLGHERARGHLARRGHRGGGRQAGRRVARRVGRRGGVGLDDPAPLGRTFGGAFDAGVTGRRRAAGTPGPAPPPVRAQRRTGPSLGRSRFGTKRRLVLIGTPRSAAESPSGRVRPPATRRWPGPRPVRPGPTTAPRVVVAKVPCEAVIPSREMHGPGPRRSPAAGPWPLPEANATAPERSLDVSSCRISPCTEP